MFDEKTHTHITQVMNGNPFIFSWNYLNAFLCWFQIDLKLFFFFDFLCFYFYISLITLTQALKYY